MKKFLSLIALTCTLALTATSGAAVFSGSLDPSDPSWAGCGSAGAIACNYDVLEFSVDTDGLYDIDAFYAGDPLNLDGFIYIFEGVFDPAGDGAGNIGSDDDGPGGSDTSQILGLSMTAGTSYFLVVTSFSDAPTSFGEPNGVWEADISGPGTVSAVPVPAAIWFMMSGLIGLIAMKRRS